MNRRFYQLSGLLLTAAALAACGGEAGERQSAMQQVSEALENVDRPEASDVDGPEDGEDPTGTVHVEVSGDASSTEFRGTADFSTGGEDLSIRMMSPDENRVLRVSAHGVIENGRPETGTFELQRTPREAGYTATYTERRDEASGSVFGVQSGTLTITSVTPEWIEGEIEFEGDSPFSGEEVTVTANFEAVCMTYRGTGGDCF